MKSKNKNLFLSILELIIDLSIIILIFTFRKLKKKLKNLIFFIFLKNKPQKKRKFPKIDKFSYGRHQESSSFTPESIYNYNPAKVNHTKKLLSELNKAKKQKCRLKRSMSSINLHSISENMELFDDTDPYYSFEEHKVITKDGFILTFFRINTKILMNDYDYYSNQYNINQSNSSSDFTDRIERESSSFYISNNMKQPILIQHGILDSSDGFLCNKEEKCLPLFLASKGYDVWLGNNRGNYYSEEHLFYDYNKNSKDYYNFSFDEIGRYDIPSMISKIQEVRKNNNKLILISHSQGATSSIAGMSLMNDYYKDSIKLLIALAPVCKFSGLSSYFLRLLNYVNLEIIFMIFRKNSLFHRSDLLSYFSEKHLNNFNYKNCKNQLIDEKTTKINTIFAGFKRFIYKKTSIDLTSFITGYLLDGNSQEINDSLSLNKLLAHVPSGSSLKSYVHYRKNRKFNRFCRFDYGINRNLLYYGKETPPDYELGSITVPCVVIYGAEDKLVNDKDIEYIKKGMINSIIDVRKYNNMGHISFQVGKEGKWLDDILIYIKKIE